MEFCLNKFAPLLASQKDVYFCPTQICVRAGVKIGPFWNMQIIVSQLQDNETSQSSVIDDFVKWCEESYLQLNISKAKDMIIDFRRNAHTQSHIH